VIPRNDEHSVLEGDASVVVKGRKRSGGLARYCQQAVGHKASVILVPCPGTKGTWGIQVKHDRIIKKGEEIFMDWRPYYPL